MAMSCDVIVLFCVVLDDCKRDSLVANMATAFGLWKQEQKVTRHSREQAKRLQVPMHPIWAADPGNESCATSSGCVCESDEISCNNPDREGEVFCCSFAMPSSCYDDGYQPWYRSIMCIYIYIYIYIYILCLSWCVGFKRVPPPPQKESTVKQNWGSHCWACSVLAM